ncbi:transposase [Streptococcus porcinus]|nr:transposase [Streptococcus porcinus]VTS27314.1 transposase [Streptococcus porcinus]VTS33892.1 transposase [Streptococcus porcinus]VTS34047.1 transposase [Streptococcus porcinus]
MVDGGFRLGLLLRAAQLARSTYYYHLKQLEQDDLDKSIKNQIQKVTMAIVESLWNCVTEVLSSTTKEFSA